MPEVLVPRFFPEATTAEEACARIEAEIAALKTPKNRGAQVYQRIMRNAVAGYLNEARTASSQVKKWRSIAEAMFWWADTFSLSSGKPFCQQMGADKNRTKADDRALSAVEAWRDDPMRKQRLSGLPDAEIVQRYLKQRVKPPRRQADRLRRMLKDGRIK